MFPTPRTIRQIAEQIGASVEGDDSVEVVAMASLAEAQAGDLTFATDEKHTARLAQSQAGAAVVARDAAVGKDCKMPLLRVGNVQEAMARLLAGLVPVSLILPGEPPIYLQAPAVIASDTHRQTPFQRRVF